MAVGVGWINGMKPGVGGAFGMTAAPWSSAMLASPGVASSAAVAAGNKSSAGTSDIFSIGKSIANVGGSAVNSAAANIAPGLFGQGAPIAGGVGPSAPGAITSAGGSAAGILAGAGIGFGIGSFNPFAQNQKNSQIGGTVGGIAGSFIPGVGTALGSIIGGTLGSLLGGFLGSRPHPASHFMAGIGDGGELTGVGFGNKHIGADFAQGVAGDVGNYFQTLAAGTGLDFSGGKIYGGIDDGRQFVRTDYATSKIAYGEAGDTRFTFDAKKPETVVKAYQDLAVETLRRTGRYSAEAEAKVRSFDPNAPKPPAPTTSATSNTESQKQSVTPSYNAPAVQAAGTAAVKASQSTYGRAKTILTDEDTESPAPGVFRKRRLAA